LFEQFLFQPLTTNGSASLPAVLDLPDVSKQQMEPVSPNLLFNFQMPLLVGGPTSGNSLRNI
jgi:hypothetical protein